MPHDSFRNSNTPPSFLEDLKKAERIFVYFHGNLGDRGLPHRVHLANLLINTGASVISMDYRGFGDSNCHPSESGLVEDVKAAISFLQDSGVSIDNVFLVGHSLGTGPILQAIQDSPASTSRLGGVILLAPYSSMKEAAAASLLANLLFPFFRLHKLRDYLLQHIDLAMSYDSEAAIAKLDLPCLILHGTLDKDIPIDQGRKLFQAVLKDQAYLVKEISGYGVSMTSKDKRVSFLELEYAGHNNLHQYQAAIHAIDQFSKKPWKAETE